MFTVWWVKPQETQAPKWFFQVHSLPTTAIMGYAGDTHPEGAS